MASYKSGVVAVVYDIDTATGSLMDIRGQTLLLLSSGSVMDNSSHHSDVEGNGDIAKIMNPSNGQVKQVIRRFGGNGVGDAMEGTNTSGNASPRTGFGNKLKWNIDGLSIVFNPTRWEVNIANA